MNLYAHSLEEKDESYWQLLEEHLRNVAEFAGEFADEFESYDLGYISGLYHDIGKYSYEFQQRIRGGRSKVNHSSAGAKEIANHIPNEAVRIILAFVISCHHGGLVNYGSPEKGLHKRLNEDIPDYGDYKSDQKYTDDIKKCNFMKMPRLMPTSKQTQYFSLFLYIKMLYSCLVDADHLDTERFCNNEQYLVRCNTDNIDRLTDKFNQHMKALTANCERTQLNQIRQDILDDCIKKANGDNGIYTLTVPTGGGKTLASMAFALEYIKNHPGLRRIIYVIPYTSIIEQNADVFRGIFGENNVLEHHSNFEFSERANDNGMNAKEKLRLSAENWDIPIIVTTNVQFFESIFSCKRSSNRKLHNIANSVVIFDEAQMFSSEFLKPCLYAIDELSANYGCTPVLCTATQPAFQQYFPEGRKTMEIVRDPNGLADKLKRVEVKSIRCLNDKELAERLFKHKQVLCIVNTKKHAYNLYSNLERMTGESADGHTYHLSTNMCPNHRRKVIAEIKEKLKYGEEIRVISTQLVEAGVDIDFPCVYRSIAGIDSVIQAAGRCNREGKLPGTGICYVFESDEKYAKTRGFLSRTAGHARETMEKYKDSAFSLEAIKFYFSLLYALEGQRLDNKEIIKSINESGAKVHFPFEDISDKFKLIEQDTVSVVVPYDEKGEKLVREVEMSLYPASYARKLQGYTVNMYRYEFESIKNIINCEVGGIYNILNDLQMYDIKTGIHKTLEIEDFMQ